MAQIDSWLDNFLIAKKIRHFLQKLDNQPYFFPEDAEELLGFNLKSLGNAADNHFKHRFNDFNAEAETALSLKLNIERLVWLADPTNKLFIKDNLSDLAKPTTKQTANSLNPELISYSRKNKSQIDLIDNIKEKLRNAAGTELDHSLEDIRVESFQQHFEGFVGYFDNLSRDSRDEGKPGINR